jgi:hypothetical protein
MYTPAFFTSYCYTRRNDPTDVGVRSNVRQTVRPKCPQFPHEFVQIADASRIFGAPQKNIDVGVKS